MARNTYYYDGTVFHSIKALAKYAGIHEKTLTARLRRGMSLEDACINTDLRCVYQTDSLDNNEKSLAQICRDHEKDFSLVKNRMKYGYSLHDALNNPKKVSKQGMPITIKGITYKSIAEAVRQLNLEDKESTIRSRLRVGTPPDQAFHF